MNKIVFVLLLGSMVVGPALAVQGQEAQARKTVIVDRFYVGDEFCAYVKRRAAQQNLAVPSCMGRSIFIATDGPREVVGDPFDGVSIAAASGCSSAHPYRYCRFHVRHARDYEVRYCFGYTRRCRRHNSPVWYYARQGGRYWRGVTCRHSVAYPYPQRCRARFGWTFDNNWRRGSFRTANRKGGHWCQRVSASGASIHIDNCRVSDKRDPFDRRSTYGRDKWRADTGKVWMRWTVHWEDGRQMRSGTSWIRQYPSGKLRKGGTW
jgi:hypothetical protein